MRKITRDAIDAFMSGQNFSRDNTRVAKVFDIFDESKFTMGLYLHGHLIARRSPENGFTMISNAGWFSNTTKERLNGIPGVRIRQKAGVWYLIDDNNDMKEWSGEWITI